MNYQNLKRTFIRNCKIENCVKIKAFIISIITGIEKAVFPTNRKSLYASKSRSVSRIRVLPQTPIKQEKHVRQSEVRGVREVTTETSSQNVVAMVSASLTLFTYSAWR